MAQQVDDAVSFCTLDEARAQLALPEEQVARLGKLVEIVNAVARAMETYCARKLKRRSSTEVIDGTGSQYLFLSDFPIAQSPAPSFWADDTGNGEFTTATQLSLWMGSGPQLDYQVVLDWNTGKARRIDGAWPRGFQNVRVTATSGIDPDEAQNLKQAQLLWIEQLWGLVGRDPSVASRSVLGMTMSFERGSGDDAYAMAPEIRNLLDPYRVPALTV